MSSLSSKKWTIIKILVYVIFMIIVIVSGIGLTIQLNVLNDIPLIPIIRFFALIDLAITISVYFFTSIFKTHIKKASKILDIVLLIGMAIYFLLACILLGYCLLLINDYLNTIIALLGLLLGIGFFISFVCLIYHSVTSKEDNKENLEETKSK